MNENKIHFNAVHDENYKSNKIYIRILLERFLKRIENLSRKEKLKEKIGLDIGCGEGHIISFLRQKEVIGTIFGADLLFDKIAYAKLNYPENHFINTDIKNLCFKDEIFDYIIATEIFEHLDNPDRAMQEIRRIAKNKAFLIISIPHEPYFHLGNIIRCKYLNRFGRTPDHRNFWNRAQFKSFIRQYAEIEGEESYRTFPWLLFLAKIKK